MNLFQEGDESTTAVGFLTEYNGLCGALCCCGAGGGRPPLITSIVSFESTAPFPIESFVWLSKDRRALATLTPASRLLGAAAAAHQHSIQLRAVGCDELAEAPLISFLSLSYLTLISWSP